jgi:nicotinate-nucleotide--dimethylbenzimidazole phosphoribosyltransferase
VTDLVELGADVDWPDSEAATSLRSRLSAGDGHGRLDELAEWLAGVQGCDPPHDFARVRIVAFGGSACAPEVADRAGAAVRIVDPITDDSTGAAIAAGVAVADDEIDSGADLLIAALSHADTDAALLVSVLTGAEPVKVLPRGAGLDPEAWMAQAIVVRDGRRRAYPLRDQPAELLAAIGAADLAAVTGFVLRAAGRRTPVLLDGLPAVSAALVAYDAQPRAVRWWRSADLSPHPAHELALTKLGQRSILDLGIGRGDGTAGALAAAVLRVAVQTAAGEPR